MHPIVKFARSRSACDEALEWLQQQVGAEPSLDTYAESMRLWSVCNQPGWLLWVALYCGVSPATVFPICMRMAEGACDAWESVYYSSTLRDVCSAIAAHDWTDRSASEALSRELRRKAASCIERVNEEVPSAHYEKASSAAWCVRHMIDYANGGFPFDNVARSAERVATHFAYTHRMSSQDFKAVRVALCNDVRDAIPLSALTPALRRLYRSAGFDLQLPPQAE